MSSLLQYAPCAQVRKRPYTTMALTALVVAGGLYYFMDDGKAAEEERRRIEANRRLSAERDAARRAKYEAEQQAKKAAGES
mmetsp:Transcript_24060/g.58684  ORF Transcript_24060/g.58684 Transcript_24060/m.58684 type:complete len:81 (-) Transcript_24060:153-395(-)